MFLYWMTFYPNGHLNAERMDTDDLDPASVAPFEPLFAGGLSFRGAVPNAPEVTIKWTGSDGGQALLSCSYRGKLFLSGALVSGRNATGDTEILSMFTQSLESIPLLHEITGGRPNPFATLAQRTERPLLAGVVWPTLPAKTFEELVGLDVLLAAVFLLRVNSVTGTNA